MFEDTTEQKQYDYNEFAEKVKEKYPQYNDLDNLTLSKKIVEKYPEYKDQVKFDEVKEGDTLKGGIQFNDFVTPSGAMNGITSIGASAIETPIKKVSNKVFNTDLPDTFIENYNQNMQQLNDDGFDAVRNGLVDMATYGKIPLAKFGNNANFLSKAGNFVINNGLVNGAIGGLESLKEKGLNDDLLSDALKSANSGLIIGGALNGITSNVPSLVEKLTGIPQKFSELALKDKNIVNTPFDKTQDYKPVQQKFIQAINNFDDVKNGVLENARGDYNTIQSKFKQAIKTLNNLNTGVYQQYNNIGHKAVTGLNNAIKKAEQNLETVLNNISEGNPQNIQKLRDEIIDFIMKSSKGGDTNLVNEKSQRAIQDVLKHLKFTSEKEKEKMLANLLNERKNNLGIIEPLDKEAEQRAIDIIAGITKKDAKYIRMTLKANAPKKARAKARETLMVKDLEDNDVEDFLGNLGYSDYALFPELYQVEGDAQYANEFIQDLANRIMDGDFVKGENIKAPEDLFFSEQNTKYYKALKDFMKNLKNGDKSAEDKFLMELSNLDMELNNTTMSTPELESFFAKMGFDDIDKLNDITNPKVKPIDLHWAKKSLYDMANYGDGASRISNDSIKAFANIINQYLRKLSPDYALANARLVELNDIAKAVNKSNLDDRNLDVSGDAMSKYLMQYGTNNGVASGVKKNVDVLNSNLKAEDMFKMELKDLLKHQASIDALKNLFDTPTYLYNPQNLAKLSDAERIGSLRELEKYTGTNFVDDLQKITQNEQNLKDYYNGIEKLIDKQSYINNPSLLTNIEDANRLKALQDFQDISQVDFMEELNKVKAKELFNSGLPIGNGGYGSSAGMSNQYRGATMGAIGNSISRIPVVGAVSDLISTALGATLFSPNKTGKALIKLGSSSQQDQQAIIRALNYLLNQATMKKADK